MAITHLIVTGVFIWFIWKKLPRGNKNKIDNTLMILFLGLIGMWLWLPNKNEIKKQNKNSTV
ncbi:MAG: hypothetical protein Q8J97_01805 [Flavobacteriaceae bacterium]|nr:hypothetical protein [Flavobacteriaceae bacterium]